MSVSEPDDTNLLHGACACERNQYTIFVPPASTSLAQVYFDNSTANRRAQATPLTAWLRVPLAWYSSTTTARFPDESHGSIKRTFAQNPKDIRRQFCGYCGTHLTAWDEAEAEERRIRMARENSGDDDDDDGGGWLDVTMGSLIGESLERLELLGLVGEGEEEEEEDDQDNENEDGELKPGTVNSESHIPTSSSTLGAEAAAVAAATVSAQQPHPLNPSSSAPLLSSSSSSRTLPLPSKSPHLSRRPHQTPSRLSPHHHYHRMRNRGIPFFETMIAGSPLGRIKRHRSGQHRSADGRTTVQWEVMEMDDGVDAAMVDNDDDEETGDHGDITAAAAGKTERRSSSSGKVKRLKTGA